LNGLVYVIGSYGFLPFKVGDSPGRFQYGVTASARQGQAFRSVAERLARGFGQHAEAADLAALHAGVPPEGRPGKTAALDRYGFCYPCGDNTA
jgi:hypothetical protein